MPDGMFAPLPSEAAPPCGEVAAAEVVPLCGENPAKRIAAAAGGEVLLAADRPDAERGELGPTKGEAGVRYSCGAAGRRVAQGLAVPAIGTVNSCGGLVDAGARTDKCGGIILRSGRRAA
jgi:hypothetical protein